MLIGLLERRLDAVVFRAKFVATIWAARQFVNHGHVTVNGKRVNIASYRVKEGDVIAIRERSRQLATGGKEPKVAWENDKPTVMALREIAAGLVDYDVIAQDDIVEEEPLFAAFEEEANEPL